VSCRGNNDTNLKLQYKRYCKILTDVIKTAKKKQYVKLIVKLISKSKNKAKTTWKIIKKIGNNSENILQYISNKMQHYTVYLYLETALHVSGGTSTHHQEYIQLYLQHLVFDTVIAICRYRGRVGTAVTV
jgi:regulator of sigma D